MVRPGLKRLQQAQRVKVQPNKTGTSVILGQKQFVRGTKANEENQKKTFTPEYTDSQKLHDQNCRCVKKKEWAKDSNGNIIPYK